MGNETAKQWEATIGRAHVIVTNALLARMKDEGGDIAHRITVISHRPFCDGTAIALITTPLLADGYHGQQDMIVEADGTIRFKRDCDV